MTPFDYLPITKVVNTQFGLNFVGETRVNLFADRGGSTRQKCLRRIHACMDALHQRGLALEGAA